MMPALQEEAATVLNDALNAHDAKKAASVYAEDAIIRVSGMTDDTGRDAIAAGIQKLFDAFSNFKFGATRVWSKGAVVVREWVGTGTHSGTFAGVKPTENPVGWTAVSVLWFSPAGLIKEEHVYWDTSGVLGQIGAARAKSSPIPSIPRAPETHTSKSSPGEELNAGLSARIAAAANARNDDQLFAFYADTLERWTLDARSRSLGKEESKKSWKSFIAAFPDAKATVVNSWGMNDWVIEESVVVGTHSAPFGGFATTKKSVTLHSLDILQIKEGKVARDWSCASTQELVGQLGPPPRAASQAPGLPASKKK